MALSITSTADALSTYVDQNRDALISGAVAGARSAENLNLQVGYKSAGSINIMDTDVVLQADAAGRTASGTTSLTQRILNVGAIKIEEDIDVKGLNAIYMQHQLKAGSADDVVPFEEAWTSLKVAKVANVLEQAIWIGDTTSGVANTERFDGLIKIIDATVAEFTYTAGAFVVGQSYEIVTAGTTDFTLIGAADSVVGTRFTATGVGVGTGTAYNTGEAVIDANYTTGAASLVQATVIAAMDDVYQSIPLDVLESGEVKIFCGFDTFRFYQSALKALNLFHHASDASDFKMPLAGTSVQIVALQGLSSTSRMFAGKPSNFVLGTDLANEEEVFDVWYSKEDKIVKLDMAFKYGTQIAFPNEIVSWSV